MHDFGTLLAKDFLGSDIGWLNDEIINAYLKLLVQREQEKRGYNKDSKAAPPVHAFPSQWHETVKKANSCKAISRWTKRALLGGPQLLDASLVLFPICDGSHWTLLAIFPKDRKIEYLDSLYTHGEDRFIRWGRDWLKVELGELYVEDEWKVVIKRSAKQDNGSDCGAFTSLNALALIRGMEPGEVVTHTNMKDARRQIAATLLQGGAHGEFDF
ncbi:cysteine proteinase [Glonium stellatum]|uniref:Cysteine proteinase n=1 Tax=Glonium stellatum TaxID=574774 RepID=A0A8E2EZP9_9PEZI|nr:cysteine proteinase [Glonium stellatum]